ncbi:MAG: hypothetical protein U0K95_03500, partial [Eubacterium sp.]|nr:hypothetical protein [Eubacterium sp.]
MLNIFYGRENLNKSRFVFQNIEGKTLLVVPNQFTLEAERDAFFYLNKKILMDIDVISFSRLGGNIIQKTGGKFNLIGREGRQMLLSRILREEEKNLEVFQGSARKMEFVEMVHDLISDMKQHNLKPDQLEDALANVNHESLLYKKLSEVKSVFESYEKAIDGKYLDNEDYIQFYVDKVKDAQFIKESSIWIYGFDTFTEKNLVFIKELEKYARNVNVVLTYDQGGRDENLFAIGKLVIDKLKGICPDATVSYIGDDYLIAESEAMQALERELFAEPVEPCSTCEEIKLVKAANPYSEAATAASFILSLVRDKGYRYKDIALISNDIENQGEMYKRVFDEYGIKLFIDSKRNVLYHPAVMYIVSLLEIMGYNFGLEDVLKILKTGFVFDTYDEEELLEKYARKFNLKGAAWKKDFEKGKSFFGDKMDEINLARKKMMEPILIFEEEYKNAKTVKDKVKALYDHIENHMDMPQKIENLVRKQEEEGNLEGAEETAQIWKVTVGLLEQLVEILGDEKISNKDFADLVKTGFQSVEIGVIPPSVDGLIAGTMQRTRRGHTKVTVVIGAADGVLPRENLETGILNEDERSFLKENNIEICKVGSIRTLEENMAIYRNISKSEDMLYMSYAASDKDGKSTEPS